MRKAILIPLALLAGGAVGGGAALAVELAFPAGGPTVAAAPTAPATFVPVGSILVPVITGDGHLTAYVTIDCSLEVGADQAEAVADRLPLLIHAVNLRTYRRPLATGPDGRLPDVGAFSAIVADSAKAVFGHGTVRRVAVTRLAEA
jgi:hypothetical protein